MKKDVIIIGAGLTGLTTAYYLKKKGFNITILEKNNRAGGVIQTLKEGDFIYETGPNTGVVGNPEVAELFEELSDSCKLIIANPEAKRRLIWKNNAWHALPSGLLSAIKTPLFSLKDKFRILGEPFRKKGTNPYECIADLVVRRLGRSYLDYAVDPFISGVYAGDPNQLITQFALPKLYQLEQNYGSFIKGAIKKKKEPSDERSKKATREVFSAEGGLSNLIHALEAAIGKENIILGAENITISQDAGNYTTHYSDDHSTVKNIQSKYVITTVGAYALPKLLPFIGEKQLSPITNLPYAKVTQVIAGYKNWNGKSVKAFGGLVPYKEKRNVLGILFTSSCFVNRAPKEGAVLSVFLGGMRRPDMALQSEDQIKSIVLNEVNNMLQQKGKPEILRVFKYEHAIPQYEISSEERFKCIKELQNTYKGLILAGNIRDGIGMADRIKQGRTIAEQIEL